MAVGIRGTSGWASVKSELVSEIHLLDGTCECAVCDPVTRQTKTGELHSGEMASCVVYPQDKAGDKCDIIMGGISTAEIPGFVLMELVEDVPLCDTIEESSGLDILADLAAVAGGNPSGRSDDGKSASPQVVGFAEEKLAEAEAENAVRLQEIADAEAQLESNVSQDNVWGPEVSGAALNSAAPREGRALQAAGASGPSQRPAASSRPTAAASPVRPVQTPSSTQTAEASSAPTEAQPSPSAATSSAPTQTSAPSARPTVTTAPTAVPTGTQGPAQTPSASSRPTSTARPSATPTASPAPSASASPSASPSASASASATASTAPSVSISPTVQPTQSSAPQPTRTFAPQPTFTTSPTAQPTFTQAPTISPAPSPLPTPSSSPTATATPEPTAEPSPSPTAEPTPSESPEPTEEPSPSPTPRPTYTVELDYNTYGGPVYTTDGIPVESASAKTDEEGHIHLSSLSDVTRIGPDAEGECRFLGWFTERIGGAEVSAETVFSEDATIYAHWEGWILRDRQLTICGQGPIGGYNDLNPAPWWGADVLSAVIDPGVTSIGDAAFAGCSELRSVEIPDSVTRIDGSAFAGCRSLTSVAIPNGVTSIEDYTFYGCESLQTVQIPESVTSIGNRAFEGCPELTVHYAGTMEDWRAVDVADDAGLADKTIVCSDGTIEPAQRPIYTVTFNYNCDGESVYDADGQRISAASAETDEDGYLSGLPAPYKVGTGDNEECTFRGWFTSPAGGAQVTADEVYSADTTIFAHWEGWCVCGTKLIYFGPGNMPEYGDVAPWSKEIQRAVLMDGVTSISPNAFIDCSELTSVELPDTLMSIGAAAFDGCSSLRRVEIPNGVTSIEDYTFYGCENLQTVQIPESVTSIGNRAFEGCPELTVHYAGMMEDWRAVDVADDAGLADKTIVCSDGTIEPAQRPMYTVTFNYNCDGEPVYDADGQRVSAASAETDEDGYLSGLPAPYKVGTGDNEECTFRGWFTSPAGGAQITADEVYSADTTIFAHWEGWCVCGTKLIYFGPGNMPEYEDVAPWSKEIQRAVLMDGVTSISPNAFIECSELTGVDIPMSVRSIGSSAFAQCSGLTSVGIPDSVMSIGDYAFQGCSSLESIALQASITTLNEGAFMDCTSLAGVRLPDSVTSIGSNAFQRCSALNNVTIPASVTRIGTGAFTDCPLGGLQYEGTVEQWNSVELASDSGLAEKTVQCTNGQVDIPSSGVRSRKLFAVALDAAGGTCESFTCWPDVDGRLTDLPEPQWEGHTFEGWFTAEEDGELVTADTVFNEDTTIYAHWKEDNPVHDSEETAPLTVKLEACGGTLAKTSVKTDDGGKLTDLPKPKREGYTFDGWFTAETGGKRVGAGTELTEGTTLYAHWTVQEAESSKTPDASFTVKFNACGGTVSPEAAKTDKDGKLASLPTPTREGHTFAGWYTAKSGGTKVIRSTVFTKSTTLYAHWKGSSPAAAASEAAACTIRFDACGGAVDPASMKTDEDGKLTSLPVPTWKGHEFQGWYADKKNGSKVTTSTVFEMNTKLYARWKELEPSPVPEPAQTPAASSGSGDEAPGSAPGMEAAVAASTRHDADQDQMEGANNA